jgi:hypothetical protein
MEAERRWEAGRPERERKAQEANERREQEEERARRIKETELKGMNLVMNYERKENRHPIDVSSQNIGYDIQSTENDDNRYIEVKAKSKEGVILITENEWNTAMELGDDYYLYVVLKCDNLSQELYIIKNPVNKFTSELNHSTKKYRIPISQIKEFGLNINLIQH